MSFTLNNSNTNYDVGVATTLAATVTGVAVGDLVVVHVSSLVTGRTLTVSDGTSSLTGASLANDGGVSTCQFFYLLASVASGSVTYTATWNTSDQARSICVYVFTPSAACVLDTERHDFVAGTNTTALVSGQITTTGSDELGFCGYFVTAGTGGSSNQQINSLAATGTLTTAVAQLFYRAFASTFTGQGSATTTSSTSKMGIIAFKIGAATTFGVQTTHSKWGGDGSAANPQNLMLTVIDSSVTKTVMVVSVGDSGASKWAPTGIARDGQSFTSIISKNDTNFEAVSIWYLDNPHVGAFNAVVTFNSGPAQVGLSALNLVGAATGTPTATGINTGTSANPTVTVAASASGDIVVGGYASDLGSDGTTTANATSFMDIEDISGDSDFNAQYQIATGASNVSTWTANAPSGGGWATVGVAFGPAAVSLLLNDVFISGAGV